jgi:DNA processing protein
MKILTLKPPLLKKLDRLNDKVKDLTFLGVDPNSIISGPVVAIVGTRKPTPYGKKVTEQLASELSRAGVVIVSGLAFGVDITAHKAVLDAGGKTIAVLPSGLKNIYPASHQKIAEKITETGSIISEYPENHMPRKVEFLERNRIIAGLSDLVIIPEAAERSGSLNTAKHAESMGIPICAVPGPINSPLSAGSNWLIQQGANLITSSDDVLKLLNIDKNANKQISLLGSNDQETAILQVIAGGINDPRLIQQAINISTADLQISLTMLEIAGRVEQNSLGAWHIR